MEICPSEFFLDSCEFIKIPLLRGFVIVFIATAKKIKDRFPIKEFYFGP
jgi:hypothetical protein